VILFPDGRWQDNLAFAGNGRRHEM
jgi:hypothetical protein